MNVKACIVFFGCFAGSYSRSGLREACSPAGTFSCRCLCTAHWSCINVRTGYLVLLRDG